MTPTQTKTSSSTPKQSSKKQNTEKGAQSKKQVGRKKETTQSPEQKNPTNPCASDKSTQPAKHQQQQQLPKDKVNQNGTHKKKKTFIVGDSPNTIHQDIHPDIRPAGNSPAQYSAATYFYLYKRKSRFTVKITPVQHNGIPRVSKISN